MTFKKVTDLHSLPATNFITRNQLAPLIGFSVQTLKRWATQNKGPRITYLEGRPRYRISDVLEWSDGSASRKANTSYECLTIDDIKNLPDTTDPSLSLCKFDEKWNVIVIRWGGYPYELDLDPVETPEHLLERLLQLTEKGWDDMTAVRIGALIHIVCRQKGWAWYANNLGSPE